MEDSGAFEIKLDGKGRMQLPTSLLPVFQQESGVETFVTRGDSSYLLLYNHSNWSVFKNSINQLNSRLPSVAKAQRVFLGNMKRIIADSTNRILLPKVLREKAQIDKEVIFLCFESRFEIWSKEIYEQEVGGNIDLSGEEFENFKL